MKFALEATLPDFESIPFGDPTITGLVLEGGLDMSWVFDVVDTIVQRNCTLNKQFKFTELLER